MVPVPGVEPGRPFGTVDFESTASAIPPDRRGIAEYHSGAGAPGLSEPGGRWRYPRPMAPAAAAPHGHSLTLQVLPGELAVVRLPPDAHVPQWAFSAAPAALWSMTRTDDELSLVRDAEAVPSDALAERGWRALRIAGTIDFALTGVLASVLAPLGDAAISIFAVSTYDTDYVLVREHALAAAMDALRSAGHDVVE